MSAHLDDLYFEWLYSQVGSVKLKSPSRTYWNLFRILYEKEFVWIIPNDDNRIEDGKDLRVEFLHEAQIRCDDRNWIELGCSVFELLVGLSRRLAFETNADPHEWFWELLENLNLHQYNDRTDIPRQEVEGVLDRVIWRTYRYNGRGGLFPLQHAKRDQRDVELWYQLGAYLLEQSEF